jgi:transcriptional regulator with XRE-family HTH domain
MRTVSQVRKKPSERSRLQALREDANLGVRELASFAGVSPATVSRVDSGKAPDIRTALRLAQFFETSVEELFGNFRAERPGGK